MVASWILSGTNKGEFRGLPPTDKKISAKGITIHHIGNGKIKDSYATWDLLGVMQQLGTTLSHYRILEKLGGGGMGVVYRGEDAADDPDGELHLRCVEPAEHGAGVEDRDDDVRLRQRGESAGENTGPVQQLGGNFERVIDAGREIGIDRATGAATQIYTIITNAAGDVVTAFPGLPVPQEERWG